MLGVHESAGGAFFLGLGNGAQGQRGLTGGLRTIDFDDPAFRQAADAQGDIQPQGAGGNGGNALALLVAHAHHRTFTELALDLRQRRRQCLTLVAHL